MTANTLASLTPLERKDKSEQLIFDLYIDLRRRVNQWALLTKQTSQARMGYVGQHLVSIVTGLEGSRTGARGDDLIYPDGERHSEVKTCYRVDQLGECLDCGFKVAASDIVCPACQSTSLKRKDDSKWLISLPSNAGLASSKFQSLFTNEDFYLVLFEFEDLNHPEVINALIWKVNPKFKGFSYCMLDYYKNIWANSASHAAFNLWPYLPKFYLMNPKLIYKSKIKSDNTIETLTFPEIDAPRDCPFPPLTSFSRSTGLSPDVCQRLANSCGITPNGLTKQRLLSLIEEYRKNQLNNESRFLDLLIDAFYSNISGYLNELPENCR